MPLEQPATRLIISLCMEIDMERKTDQQISKLFQEFKTICMKPVCKWRRLAIQLYNWAGRKIHFVSDLPTTSLRKSKVIRLALVTLDTSDTRLAYTLPCRITLQRGRTNLITVTWLTVTWRCPTEKVVTATFTFWPSSVSLAVEASSMSKLFIIHTGVS